MDKSLITLGLSAIYNHLSTNRDLIITNQREIRTVKFIIKLQNLYYGVNKLEDDHLISYYDVTYGSVIHMDVGLKGGISFVYFINDSFLSPSFDYDFTNTIDSAVPFIPWYKRGILVNPKTLVKVAQTNNQYWISPNDSDIRPYGICIKKV
ncbi:hypothetical protein ACTFIY_006929 [Dictyostelium cf. discoideum]